jgi:DNA-nicking Smr family endonuclease
MSKKNQLKDFRNTPFKELKGVSVCPPVPPASQPVKVSPQQASTDDGFFEQMAQLGVKPLAPGGENATPASAGASRPEVPGSDEAERQLFLETLGTLDAPFRDEFPEPDRRPARPSRMKLLQRGKLEIEATLDLHGLSRVEALERTGHFLDNACFHQLQTVLIVTGKGVHSAGEAVLRTVVEDCLQAHSYAAVLEWGRAPREHGGEGALVVFLRRSNR